jgi:hypothetical protein
MVPPFVRPQSSDSGEVVLALPLPHLPIREFITAGGGEYERDFHLRKTEIVAARLGDEVIVKTLNRSGGPLWPHPENPVYDDILGDDAVIMSKIVAILRRR